MKVDVAPAPFWNIYACSFYIYTMFGDVIFGHISVISKSISVYFGQNNPDYGTMSYTCTERLAIGFIVILFTQ